MELIGALGLLGGILTALGTVITALNSRRKETTSEQASFRQELREEIKSLRDANADCNDSLSAQRKINEDLWRRVGEQNSQMVSANTRIFELERRLGIYPSTPFEGLVRPQEGDDPTHD